MAITNTMVLELVNEGIQTVNDLYEFDKMLIKSISLNLCCPAEENPLVLRAKSQTRLVIACDLIQYYETFSLFPSAINMQWIPVMKKFNIM